MSQKKGLDGCRMSWRHKGLESNKLQSNVATCWRNHWLSQRSGADLGGLQKGDGIWTGLERLTRNSSGMGGKEVHFRGKISPFKAEREAWKGRIWNVQIFSGILQKKIKLIPWSLIPVIFLHFVFLSLVLSTIDRRLSVFTGNRPQVVLFSPHAMKSP